MIGASSRTFAAALAVRGANDLGFGTATNISAT
jgi:hypothetical protein